MITVCKLLKDDKKLVAFAVVGNPIALESASDRLKDDRELVKFAVGLHPNALEFASMRLRDDLDIVWAAVFGDNFVLEDNQSLQFASERLKTLFTLHILQRLDLIFSYYHSYVQKSF